MYLICIHRVDLCGLWDSLAWFWIHNTIDMQKFRDISNCHDTESDKSFSVMTKLLIWVFFFISESAVKYLISLACLWRVEWRTQLLSPPIFQRIEILAHTPGIYHRVRQGYLVNIMLSIKLCSAVFLNLMTTWNNCWAMWILKFFLNAVSSAVSRDECWNTITIT